MLALNVRPTAIVIAVLGIAVVVVADRAEVPLHEAAHLVAVLFRLSDLAGGRGSLIEAALDTGQIQLGFELGLLMEILVQRVATGTDDGGDEKNQSQEGVHGASRGAVRMGGAVEAL